LVAACSISVSSLGDLNMGLDDSFIALIGSRDSVCSHEFIPTDIGQDHGLIGILIYPRAEESGNLSLPTNLNFTFTIYPETYHAS
jgi:hypothetical protein